MHITDLPVIMMEKSKNSIANIRVNNLPVEYDTTLGAGNWSLIRTREYDILFMWCINTCNLTTTTKNLIRIP